MAYKHVIRAKTKNLFDISKVTNYPPTYNVDNSYLKTKPLSISSIIFLKETLIQLCPNLISGNTYVFNAKTTGKYQQILLNDIVWEFGTARTLTDADLNNAIGLYAEPTNTADEWTIISEIQIEEGSTPTPYTPYNYLQSNKRMIKVSDVCQLLDKSKYPATQTINGVTFTNNGDGSITVNGTATDRATLTYTSFIKPFLSGKFLLVGCPNGGSNNTYFGYTFSRGKNGNFIIGVRDIGNGGILNYDITTRAVLCQIIVMKDTVCDNIVFKPQLFDLTEMYGAGNEPTTVEQFRQDFPEEMYDYKPYCFVKSYKTLLKASDNKIITSYKKSFKVTNSILL